MLGASPFFKKSPITDMRARQSPITDMRARPAVMPNRNLGVRPSVGHPRYGFKTLLNQDSFGQLPIAPAIVGGNVDWTQSKVSPITQQLHNVLSDSRTMLSAPALGTDLRLRVPTINSIHTTY